MSNTVKPLVDRSEINKQNRLGKKHTQATKDKISASKRGEVRSEEFKRNISIRMTEYWKQKRKDLANKDLDTDKEMGPS